MKKIVAINDLGNLPEAGRIRTGVKSGKFAKALEHFRLTSTNEHTLQQLAAIYGGTVKKWYDKDANPPNQYELLTTSDVLDVVATPGSFDLAYELWNRGGIARRCDGETVTEWVYNQDSLDKVIGPCICNVQGMMECQTKTRVSFMFPSIDFTGVWRYESSGAHAAHSLPSMLTLVEALQETNGLMALTMHLVPRERVIGPQKKKWTVVELRTKTSIDKMLAGAGTYDVALTNGQPTVHELPASTSSPVLHITEEEDDEIAEAELVEDEDDIPVGVMTRTEAFAQAKKLGSKAKVKKVDGGWVVQ